MSESHPAGDEAQSIPPRVSIVCTTYNQEKFVGSALESFLAQETSFQTEILVHDDASTDGTAEIIRAYAAKRPDAFRVIVQSENQYSRGVWPIQLAMLQARGEYIAICEGDDYWTDPRKLATQVALLDANPDASGCFHRADGFLDETGQTVEALFGPPVSKGSFGVDDFLEGDNFVPTASLVLRRECCGVLPAWVSSAPHADLVILTLAALAGPVLFIDKSMSVYRKHADGIHSRDAFAIQAVKCLKTLIVIGRHLGVNDLDSYTRGTTYRISQIEGEIRRFSDSVARLKDQEAVDRKTIDRIMKSRTFRVGLALSRMRDQILKPKASRSIEVKPGS